MDHIASVPNGDIGEDCRRKRREGRERPIAERSHFPDGDTIVNARETSGPVLTKETVSDRPQRGSIVATTPL